jgi:hypothetical protein
MMSGGAIVNLPASYLAKGSGSTTSPELTAGFLGTVSAASIASQARLLWKHDNYIYADYQLLQQFGSNFISNQQNMIYMPYLGDLPRALVLALANNSDVELATGEYGSISMDIVHYTQRYNDPTLTSISGVLKGLTFQPLPASSHTLQLMYFYPFCVGCGFGSTVPESFNFGLVIPPASLRKTMILHK